MGQATTNDAPQAVDKSNRRVREMFGQIAPRYDLLNHLLSLNVDRYWRWRTVHLAPPTGDDPILDVCTGTGDLALAYFHATGGRAPVVGSDFCPEMLEIGQRKKLRWRADDRLTFVEADAQCLPFCDDYFGLVTVAFGLRNIADTDLGLREMVRVCQPGGRVAVLEFSVPERQPLKTIYGWYFRRILPRVGEWLARNEQAAYSYLPASVAQFSAGQELVQRMEQAGLEQVVHRSLTMGIAGLYVGYKPVLQAYGERRMEPR